MTRTTQGIFISVEGGEGVGKSSFCHGLCDFLKKQNLEIILTREPGGTEIAERIRSVFTSPPQHENILPVTELFLISSARAQHWFHRIKPSIHQGNWVVCDRYADSTRVYQGTLGGINISFMEQVIAQSTENISPDLTFILDCPTKIALQRLEKRNDHTASRYDLAHESLHEKIRQGYLSLLKQFPDRMILLDATKEPSIIVHNGIQEIRKRFLK